MSKIKRILVKSLLCLSLVLGITVFVSGEAEACPGDGCTCPPWRSMDGQDYRGACSTTWMSCEFWCDGHSYPWGVQTEE